MENKEESDAKASPAGGDTGIFKCLECNSIFKRRDHLGRHVMTQHDENSHRTKCPLKDCDTEMVRRDHLRRHISQVHKVDPSEVLPYSRRKPSFKKPTSFDPTQRFKCVYDGCDAELSRKDHLCRHIKNIHKADPREVIGHMYKQPRSSTSPGGSVVGAPIATSTPTSATSTTGKSKKRSKKKRGGITNAEDSSLASHSSDHHHPNHHPGHHPHQPHPSTLSDYDYGADFCYGGPDSDYEWESETEYDWEEDAVLCFLCCFSFYPEDPSEMEDLSKNFQFHKLISEIFMEHDGSFSCGPLLLDSTKFLSSLKRLVVCSDCFALINAAMDSKLAVEDVEVTVRRLQMEILLAMKALQERLAEYSFQMKSIEELVSGAEKKSLKQYMGDNLMLGLEFDNNMVEFLRERIVATSNKLQEVDEDVQIKCCDAPPQIQQLEESSAETGLIDDCEGSMREEDNIENSMDISALPVDTQNSVMEIIQSKGDGKNKGNQKENSEKNLDSAKPAECTQEEEIDAHQEVAVSTGESEKADKDENQEENSSLQRQEQKKNVSVYDNSIEIISEAKDTGNVNNCFKVGIPVKSGKQADSDQNEQNDKDKNPTQKNSSLQENQLQNSVVILDDDNERDVVPESEETPEDFHQHESNNSSISAANELACTSNTKTAREPHKNASCNKDVADKLEGACDAHQEQNAMDIRCPEKIAKGATKKAKNFQVSEENNQLREFFRSITGENFSHETNVDRDENASSVESRPDEHSDIVMRNADSFQLEDGNTGSEEIQVLSTKNEKLIQRADWSLFKKNIIKEVEKRFQKRSENSFNTSASSSSSFQQQHDENIPDDQYLKYNPEMDELFIDQITVIINEEVKSLQCSQCPLRTIKAEHGSYLSAKQKVKKTLHLMEHHIQRKHMPLYLQNGKVCEICDRAFINENSLGKQVWDTQTQESNFQMSSQNYPSGQDSQQRNSLNSVPMDVHQCSICNKKFTRVSNLRMHEKVHTDNPERDICLCSFCGNLYFGKASLNRHQEQSCVSRKTQENGNQSNPRKRRKLDSKNTSNFG